MARAIWKGTISFGLVSIPVGLFAAESKRKLAFHMLDERDLARVRQKRVNESTGEEVPWEGIVKGYEYAEGQYVVLTEDDFRAADVEATQTIDIKAFVEAGEIGVEYFEQPYYLEPAKPGRKAYALLRETLKRTGRVAVAMLVLRNRQHLCTLVPQGPMVLCDLMRFHYEIRDASQFDVPSEDLDELGINEGELKMAEQLVGAMAAKWEPEGFRDTYEERLLATIEEKARTGQVEAPPPPVEPERMAEVVDIMGLLKRSVEGTKAAEETRGDGGRAGKREKAGAGGGRKRR
ncbi:MAG: Ku protein [Coriobacteriia bacterium]|nr:Ku protein [Coriobacteriia bacterium]